MITRTLGIPHPELLRKLMTKVRADHVSEAKFGACRDAPGVGHYEMSPTPESSPVRELGKGQDSVSLEVTSQGMGRPFTYSVQFVAPCLVRYYMPGVCS